MRNEICAAVLLIMATIGAFCVASEVGHYPLGLSAAMIACFLLGYIIGEDE